MDSGRSSGRQPQTPISVTPPPLGGGHDAAASTAPGGQPQHSHGSQQTAAAPVPTRFIGLNGVDYPASVVPHIPKYYLPKPHLKKQKYPPSAVLQCFVDPDVIDAAEREYMRYAKDIVTEAVKTPYADKFKPQPQSTSLSDFRLDLGSQSRLRNTAEVQQLVLEWDAGALDDSIEAPLVKAEQKRRRGGAPPPPEPFLVRVPADALPAHALKIALRSVEADAQAMLARGVDSSQCAPGFRPWTSQALQRVIAMCEDQLKAYADLDAQAEAEQQQQQQGGNSSARRHRRPGPGGRRRRHKDKDHDKARKPQPGADGEPPTRAPLVGLRPCDLFGAIFQPEKAAGGGAEGAGKPRGSPGLTGSQPPHGAAGGSGVLASSGLALGGLVTPAARTGKKSVSIATPSARGGGRSATPNFAADRLSLPGGSLAPAKQQRETAGATLNATSSKMQAVARQVDPKNALVPQLNMPFSVALTIDSTNARNFVQWSNTAARVTRQQEVERREGHRGDAIAKRDERIREREAEQLSLCIERDADVREALRLEQSTGLLEVDQWRKERELAERQARLEVLERERRAEEGRAKDVVRNRMREVAQRKVACEFDESERREVSVGEEAEAFRAIAVCERLAREAILKRQRIRQRMRMVPGDTDRIVLQGAA